MEYRCAARLFIAFCPIPCHFMPSHHILRQVLPSHSRIIHDMPFHYVSFHPMPVLDIPYHCNHHIPLCVSVNPHFLPGFHVFLVIKPLSRVVSVKPLLSTVADSVGTSHIKVQQHSSYRPVTAYRAVTAYRPEPFLRTRARPRRPEQFSSEQHCTANTTKHSQQQHILAI